MPVLLPSSTVRTRSSRANILATSVVVTALASFAIACGADEPASSSSAQEGTSAGDPNGGSSGTGSPQFVYSTDAGAAASCAPSSPDQKGCACTAGQSRACYTGPASTRNLGACHDGVQPCIGGGEFGAAFGPCQGEVVPSASAVCVPASTLDVDAGQPWTDLSSPACNFGGTIVSPKTSVTAYETATVPYGQPCKSEQRVCEGGKLSGSFTFAACTPDTTPPPPPPCTFNGQAIPNGGSVAAYTISTGYCAGAMQTRYCYNGVLSGTGDYASCTPAAASVGQACTPDSAIAVASNASAVTGCSSGWAFASNPTNSLYCDASGKWQCFLAGGCEPSACTACMAAHCTDKVAGGSASCSAGLQRAFSWLSTCGPDRPAYFNSFGASCSAGELGALNGCKFQYCYGAGGGPCNGY